MTLLVLFTLWWCGAALIASSIPALTRLRIEDRISPYQPAGVPTTNPGRATSMGALREVLGPLAAGWAERITSALGHHDDLERRLRFVRSPLDVPAVRLRQAAWSIAALFGAVFVVAFADPPAVLAVAVLVGAPSSAFAAFELRVSSAARQRTSTLVDELPVVAEQLAILLGAGYSLSGALDRIARRSSGVVAADLTLVGSRVRHGLTEQDALAEWAAVAACAPLDRLVAVLALERTAPDLAHLVLAEARMLRDERQRQLIEQVERRTQQVWIPVTLAALLPGVAFLSVPFIDALNQFNA